MLVEFLHFLWGRLRLCVVGSLIFGFFGLLLFLRLFGVILIGILNDSIGFIRLSIAHWYYLIILCAFRRLPTGFLLLCLLLLFGFHVLLLLRIRNALAAFHGVGRRLVLRYSIWSGLGTS